MIKWPHIVCRCMQPVCTHACTHINTHMHVHKIVAQLVRLLSRDAHFIKVHFGFCRKYRNSWQSMPLWPLGNGREETETPWSISWGQNKCTKWGKCLWISKHIFKIKNYLPFRLLVYNSNSHNSFCLAYQAVRKIILVRLHFNFADYHSFTETHFCLFPLAMPSLFPCGHTALCLMKSQGWFPKQFCITLHPQREMTCGSESNSWLCSVKKCAGNSS